MKTISLENVILFHKKIVAQTGGNSGIRDIGLIESALNRALITFDGKELYQEVERKVAVITHSLIRLNQSLNNKQRIISLFNFLFS